LPSSKPRSPTRRRHDAIQQAKDYAEILGLKFAYATNGEEIIEFDFFTGRETIRADFPPPDELWRRQRVGLGLADDTVAAKVLTSGFPDPPRPRRYYQEIAINRAVQAIMTGQRRVLLTLCTDSGKTAVAFQLSWRLWSAAWNKRGKTGRGGKFSNISHQPTSSA
jgi:type I restriction enzyme, R subunit